MGGRKCIEILLSRAGNANALIRNLDGKINFVHLPLQICGTLRTALSTVHHLNISEINGYKMSGRKMY